MSTGATTATGTHETPGVWARAADYAELIKPRITILELVTVVAAMHLAIASTGGVWRPGVVASMLLGTTLLAASANTLNQYLESRHDRLMTRTKNRPLPAGRLRPGEAAALGIVCVAVGVTLLAFGVGVVTAMLGLACWFLYVGVYTPMKRVSTWNTTVGAVSGALPIVMGWTAGGGRFDLAAFGLFAVLLLWQYPHFMAIAWLCRDDYARAGYRMLSVTEPTGRRAAAQGVAGAALLVPAALLPATAGDGSVVYATLVVLLALMQFAVALAFYARRTDRRARLLLRASLVFLPTWMLIMAVCLP